MNVLNIIEKDDIINIFIEFLRENIINTDTDTTKGLLSRIYVCNYDKITIDDKLFDKPSYLSLKYLLTVLMREFDVSIAVFYWIMSCLFRMKNVDYVFNIEDIHYMILFLHNLGSKIIEDVVYDTVVYFQLLGLNKKHMITIEMELLLDLLDNIRLVDIFITRDVDKILYKIISKICVLNIDFIEHIDHNISINANIFYNDTNLIYGPSNTYENEYLIKQRKSRIDNNRILINMAICNDSTDSTNSANSIDTIAEMQVNVISDDDNKNIGRKHKHKNKKSIFGTIKSFIFPKKIQHRKATPKQTSRSTLRSTSRSTSGSTLKIPKSV